ncbi:MAG: flagellar basal body P-ring protein FlgI [Brevundimonas sp.]|uniref:flagellar basal body P-ring protein FlgI n=1 Tax=Brevundimonas sp. TaxID=1871086 RepID=UPI0027373FD9|nr:flagellar basal body P-ring protein FlgI [Brevundimonas sp.]MBX9614133.1 flagellar basal body P-ring protein FlgI [Caulobacteraceae bacterium]MDP3405508.1 flagellar basal body P-ring protein FlgI [Brevundimonas sp.]
MQKILTAVLASIAATALVAGPVVAQSRIKDIAAVEGVRTNQLVGYGLVVGLNGTGDSLRNCPFTRQSLEGMTERLGVNIRGANANSKNLAAIMVTAELPPFATPGARIDVSVSSLCDAKSLLGGTLLVTSLQGADGEVYAVAQGSVQTGAVSGGGGGGSSVTRGVPTAGRIASGATVERETGFNLDSLEEVRLTLRNPDFTTAQRVAAAINATYPSTALAENGSVVALRAPSQLGMAAFISRVENMPVAVDTPARVIIDEVNGVIVMGENVRISTVAIAQGNLTISVQETPLISQPAPFGQGQTVVVPQTDVTVEEELGREIRIVNGATSLSTLVNGLNALGVSPRDMISILQAIKAAGALQADIEVL